MQVNSRNLRALGVGVFQAFNPCTNISAGATILSADYANASRLRGPGQAALQAALSAYNTGDFYRGFENGYVARYYGRSAFSPQQSARVPSVRLHQLPPILSQLRRRSTAGSNSMLTSSNNTAGQPYATSVHLILIGTLAMMMMVFGPVLWLLMRLGRCRCWSRRWLASRRPSAWQCGLSPSMNLLCMVLCGRPISFTAVAASSAGEDRRNAGVDAIRRRDLPAARGRMERADGFRSAAPSRDV